MTFIVFVAFIVLAARIVYLEYQRHDDQAMLAWHRQTITEYYMTLRTKREEPDFIEWARELQEPDA